MELPCSDSTTASWVTPNVDFVLRINGSAVPYRTLDCKQFFFPSFSLRSNYRWFQSLVPGFKLFSTIHTILDDIRDIVKATRGKRNTVSRLTNADGTLQLSVMDVKVRGHTIAVANDARLPGVELTKENVNWLFLELSKDATSKRPRVSKTNVFDDDGDDDTDGISSDINLTKKCSNGGRPGSLYWAESKQAFVCKQPLQKAKSFTMRKRKVTDDNSYLEELQHQKRLATIFFAPDDDSETE